MIIHYFKTAWRNLCKNKLFSFINILGLGLAIPFALLSLMQVQSTFEFDNFHPGAENIYRIITDVESKNGDISSYASSPIPLAEELEQGIPFVEKATATKRASGWELTDRFKTIRVNSLYVEPDFFNLFAFPLDNGSFSDLPNTLVISKEMAEVFFGDLNPVGQILSHHDYGDFTVTGVLKPYKSNTHFKSDVMVSMATIKKIEKLNRTDALSGFTYVKLHPKADKEDLDAVLIDLSNRLANINPLQEQKSTFRSQKFTDISPDLEGLLDNPYAKSFADLSVNLFMALAIILLAGFNYTNLTLARSLSRAKEVGVRKVAGASRSQLILQFICESILVALLALVIGFFVLKLMEDYLTINWLVWEVDNYIILWSVFLVFTIVTGIIAGIIPAKILSSFSPAKVLKGEINPSSFGKTGFRKSLVVVQFVVTSCFIFLISNMYSQFKYQANDNENYNRKNIYNISVSGNYQLLRNEIAGHKDVDKIGLASAPFGATSVRSKIKKDKLDPGLLASFYAVNNDFIENMHLKFMAGNNLADGSRSAASSQVVVNEQAIYELNLGNPAEAVGRTFFLNDEQQVVIQGVVQNFNFNLYQFQTEPLVLQNDPSKFNILSIKVKGEVDEDVFKSEMAALYKKHFPHEEMAYSNYEEELYNRYFQGEEMKFMAMVGATIFIIAIMGLLGIVTYTTEKRFKEIGIRKVLGASVTTIVKELSGGFLKLLLISTVICLPLGYLISFLFINNFAYNGGIPIGLMLLLMALILAIALFTIAIQAARAAVANPAEILRTQ